MNTTFKLSLRNLSRQKRRNIILAAAIAFGFFIVTMIDGLTSGMVDNLENMIIQLNGGNVLVAGYEKTPPENEGEKSKLVNIIRDRNYIKNLIENSDINYEHFSYFSIAQGQMIFNGAKSLALVYGRDFSDKNFQDSFQLVEGNLENIKDPKALIISDKTAESLNLKVGDQVLITAQTIYGQNNVDDFTIAAIMKSNNIMNTMQLYANIETINALIGLPEDAYSTFSVYLKNKNEQLSAALKIEDLLQKDGKNTTTREKAAEISPKNIDKGIDKQLTDEEYQWKGIKYGVECLNDAIPAIKTVMLIVHSVSTSILLIILLIVMIGVSNTYRMVLYERIREIGTMRALGMKGSNTRRVFTTEAIILCIFGAIIGVILAGITMYIIHLIPITNESLSFFLQKGHFSFKLSVQSILIQYLLLILLTTIAVRGSAKKAAQMSPAQALRTVK